MKKKQQHLSKAQVAAIMLAPKPKQLSGSEPVHKWITNLTGGATVKTK